MEIDWESASPEDLDILTRELRRKFDKKGLVLAVALRPEQVDIEETLAKNVDFIILRAWYSSRFPEIAESPAPMSFVTAFVNELLNKGVPSNKIVLGVPFFGWSYVLKKESNRNYETNLPAVGFGIDGKYTGSNGQLAYFEVMFY